MSMGAVLVFNYLMLSLPAIGLIVFLILFARFTKTKAQHDKEIIAKLDQLIKIYEGKR
ncbi:hypothetical protein [Desulfoscipio geothermicus]|uniref:Uncharacterized protein n=1 Tax=Desulfoscipio geothermicus DSM 3669 TaxID=1121426 RepID=A0A1I6EHL4_9FIRM|nr:hypothetical protein [Desulfoscipio geothermicus]SFR17250.1 hypothetical protein SAMN05660706_14511 [Desulfoscipio geothermicus DSM 3669]